MSEMAVALACPVCEARHAPPHTVPETVTITECGACGTSFVLQSEAQHQQTLKMEAVGRLAGAVAHDFNNLLTAILGYCELLIGDLDPADPHMADIAEIQKAAVSGAGLTRQLLAFTRNGAIKPTLLDLNLVVADMQTMLGRLTPEDVTMVVNLSTEQELVTADRGQIEQIILNLAVNARDAMPAGGLLTIETAGVELAARDAMPGSPVQQAGAYAVLTVTDTGTGITPPVRARLFEPFFTTKEIGKGTGLGLATIHTIVTAAGGGVEVDSEVGRGTSFRVFLPRADVATPVAAEAPLAALSLRPATQTVLVVDDAQRVRELVGRLLRWQGYTVLIAADANEAIDLFEEHAGIDVLVTDIVMPGTSGPELARQLLRRRPALKAIYMSGYSKEAIVQREGGLNPAITFLHKPFTAETLGRGVSGVLDG